MENYLDANTKSVNDDNFCRTRGWVPDYDGTGQALFEDSIKVGNQNLAQRTIYPFDPTVISFTSDNHSYTNETNNGTDKLYESVGQTQRIVATDSAEYAKLQPLLAQIKIDFDKDRDTSGGGSPFAPDPRACKK